MRRDGGSQSGLGAGVFAFPDEHAIEQVIGCRAINPSFRGISPPGIFRR